MAKIKEQYRCELCEGVSPKWQGQCPHCGAWNSMQPFKESPQLQKKERGRPAHFTSLGRTEAPLRYISGIHEFDRVLSGGMVQGSIILLGGDPGIGKSTLALQLCRQFSDADIKTCYFSGEESAGQLSLRATRLGFSESSLMISNDVDLGSILAGMDKKKPQIAVIDSIQTIFSTELDSLPGSMNQIRECASELMSYGKKENITIILIGHITKSGAIAGPKLLEHIVDTVLYLEGDKLQFYRILRSVKNRFGATHEIGIFEMKEKGLCGIEDPGALFLAERKENVSGSVIACGMEGSRPLLIEIQALAARAAYGTPQRHASGIDQKRLQLLLAVIERKLNIPVAQYDVFVNIVGGLSLKEPALDLPVIAAICSSIRDQIIPGKTVIIGEVGLTGETRSVLRIEQRVKEALRMGFNQLILPATSKKKIYVDKGDANIRYISDVSQIFENIL